MALQEEQLLNAYRTMRTIREFEERVTVEFEQGGIPGFVHVYDGQEAVATGACMHLTKDDYVGSTHRGHGHCIAKGCDIKGMMAEIMGRATGLCRGKGGSMHIADQENGNLGANAIVGGSAGIATGAALSAKNLNRDDVTVCFFGDGALGQGLLYEVMNMAALWSLPVIYACENNLYGEYTKVEEMAAGELTGRAKAFGIEAFELDGQDVLAVNDLSQKLVARARNGEGPFFMQLNTYRYHGHHIGDINREYYRSKDEEKYWKEERDPITNFGEWLVKENISSTAELETLRNQVNQDAADAVAYALNASYPSSQEVDMHVFV